MGVNVLVVDNDEAFASILKESLESIGDYRVTIALTAEEALSQAIEGDFRLAVVDMGLEDMDSRVLLKTLREVRPSLKLMVIPVDDEPPEVEGVEILGTITKPFFVGELGEIIEGALAHGLVSSERAPERVEGPSPAEEEATSELVEELPSEFEPPEAEVAPVLEEAPELACDSEEVRRTLARVQHEMGAQQLILGNLGDTCIWVGGTESEARALHSWTLGIFREDFPLRAKPFGELYYRCPQGSVYALRLSNGYVLAALFSEEVRLGMVRLRMRELSEELTK